MPQPMPEYRRDLVRELRRGQTESEKILWDRLRSGRMDGLKFRRQRPLGRYIADFCCDALKLVVEIDGGVHNDQQQKEYDSVRDATLTAYGYTVVRLRVEEILLSLPQSLAKIRQAARLQSRTPEDNTNSQ